MKLRLSGSSLPWSDSPGAAAGVAGVPLSPVGPVGAVRSCGGLMTRFSGTTSVAGIGADGTVVAITGGFVGATGGGGGGGEGAGVTTGRATGATTGALVRVMDSWDAGTGGADVAATVAGGGGVGG